MSISQALHIDDIRRKLFRHKRQILLRERCCNHHDLSAEMRSVVISSLALCPFGHEVCDVCIASGDYQMCNVCNATWSECAPYCQKCDKYICLECGYVEFCEYCDMCVCKECGYDFCETCMATVCHDCGVVTWDCNKRSSPRSTCTYCVTADEPFDMDEDVSASEEENE